MAMTKQEYRQVSGLLRSYEDFHNLVETLHDRGYKREDISVLMSSRTRDMYFAARENTKAPEGFSIGGVTGGLLGALLGGMTMIGNLVTPGLGLMVSGPIVGILTGSAVGGATGGLIGALIGAGMPEHEARFFEDALEEDGKILLVAHVPAEEAREVEAVFERFDAEKVRVYH